MHRLHLLIRGRVQGVGFRFFVLRKAHTLRVTGWVCNRADGAVEVEAEGRREDLEALVASVRAGPPGARVSDVQQRWSQGEAIHHDFEVTG